MKILFLLLVMGGMCKIYIRKLKTQLNILNWEKIYCAMIFLLGWKFWALLRVEVDDGEFEISVTGHFLFSPKVRG